MPPLGEYPTPYYPTTVPYETVTFPVKKVGTRALLALEELQNQRYVIGPEKSDLWQLQLAVFSARMDTLKWMIREGYQPVGDQSVFIDIRVEQKAVSVEAGDIDHLPEDLLYVTAYRSGGNSIL